MPPIINFLAVGAGGAAGAMLRYLLQALASAPDHKLFATAAINVVGSFVIGILAVALQGRTLLMPLLMAGLLGGFTTYSSFSLDTILLLREGRFAAAALYIAATTLLALAAAAAGYALALKLLKA